VLLDNRYVFQPFWDFQSDDANADDWEQRIAASKTAAHRALSRGDTLTVLNAVMERLYTPRNQLVHAGATRNSSVNRDQPREGSAFLADLVPQTTTLMMDNPNTIIGDMLHLVVWFTIDKDELRALQEVGKELIRFDDRQLVIALAAGEIVEICDGDDKAK